MGSNQRGETVLTLPVGTSNGERELKHSRSTQLQKDSFLQFLVFITP
jgi:hypothetical protein